MKEKEPTKVKGKFYNIDNNIKYKIVLKAFDKYFIYYDYNNNIYFSYFDNSNKKIINFENNTLNS